MLASLRRLFLDGLLVAIPLALLGVLAFYALSFFREVVRPLVKILPVDSVLGLGVLTIGAILALILVVLTFGLIVRWRARDLVTWIEKKVLARIPIYQMVKLISQDVVDPDASDLAVLVDVYGTGTLSLGVLVEESDDGRCVVFLPDAPSAATGRVMIVPGDRLQKLDARGHEILEVVMQRGIGAADVLRPDEGVGPAPAAGGA